MTGVGWFMTIILGGFAGWAAEKIMKADMGMLANIVVGILGAVSLNFVLGLLSQSVEGWVGQSIVAIIGACILIALYRTMRGHR